MTELRIFKTDNQVKKYPITKICLLVKAVVLLFFLPCCNSGDSNKKQVVQKVDTIQAVVKLKEPHPALVEGEFELSEDCFGDLIELQGSQKITNEIFSIKETEMLVKDSLLLVKNIMQEHLFMIFSLPEFKLIKQLGKMGKGPNEFQFPSLVPAQGNECLCYINENATNTLYRLNKNLTISKLDFKITEARVKRFIGDKQIYSFNKSNFIYAESIKGGRAVFSFSLDKDSIQNQQIFNLSFSEAHKSWASYIGDFGANGEKKRAVYAYKYFKRLVFMDLESGKTRTLKFSRDEAEKGKPLSIMSPQNTTHYWGMCARENYVYVLYSGRSPVEVTKEWGKEKYYIFVEQFDWNGNPFAKYKLDNWGYFCVDEQNKKLYLASTNHGEAFFEYQLK